MAAKVLITGASGLIGKQLVDMLTASGYMVNTLGRSKTDAGNGTQHFAWDIQKGEMDAKALDGVDTIIHLAGAGVAEKRWTDDRKKEIIESRVKSADLLFNFLKTNNQKVKTFISASAVGYYGDGGDEVIKEDHLPGTDFLAEVCVAWEQAAQQFTQLGIREVRFRIGIVLAPNGGALPELTKTLPIGVAGYFAKNNLYYPWVHVDDVAGMMVLAIENRNIEGAYNATGNKPLLMKELMEEIVKASGKKALVVPAPPFAIKLAMGEMSSMLLNSQRCSNRKIADAGYQFRFRTINAALKHIFKSKD